MTAAEQTRNNFISEVMTKREMGLPLLPTSAPEPALRDLLLRLEGQKHDIALPRIDQIIPTEVDGLFVEVAANH